MQKVKTIFIKYLEEKPYYWEHIPEKFKQDKDFYTKAFEIAKFRFIGILGDSPAAFKSILKEFKNKKDFVQRAKISFLKALANYKNNWYNIPQEFKNDPDFLNRSMKIPGVKEIIEKERGPIFQADSSNWYRSAMSS